MKARLIINEIRKGVDVLPSIGIGPRTLIRAWLDEMRVENYTINDDLTIDVRGFVNLQSKGIDSLPEYITFGRVTGVVYLQHNGLTTLRGCPRSCYSLNCQHNKLESLQGCTQIVGANFKCYNNLLTSLDGCPTQVANNFDCEDNPTRFTVKDVTDRCRVDGSITV